MSEVTESLPTDVEAVKPAKQTVDWDDSSMQSSYANVVNASSTREEVSLFFGTNQTWKSEPGEFQVKLNNRIVLSPYAAKRQWILLGTVLKEYESRFGKLGIDSAVDGGSS
ncbi:MAG: DUF3467 domain-containing protein [Pseudomonadales bacterium]|nr:DUF3467 domain-containing protein [Pseudomonadales bacterium]